jgi:hypothetical protein
VATDDPVTRGICEVNPSGHLVALTERRKVARQADGMSFRSGDGVEPALLSGDLPTSVNLWGFQPAIWDVFESAMDASGLDEEALIAEAATGGGLVGVTHAADLLVVSGAGPPGGLGHAAQQHLRRRRLSGSTAETDRPVNSERRHRTRQTLPAVTPSALSNVASTRSTASVTGISESMIRSGDSGTS